MRTTKKFIALILVVVFASSLIAGIINAIIERDIQALIYIFFMAGFALIIPVTIGSLVYHLILNFLTKRNPGLSKLKYKFLIGLSLSIIFGAIVTLLESFLGHNFQLAEDNLKRFVVVAVYFGTIIPFIHHRIFKASDESHHEI